MKHPEVTVIFILLVQAFHLASLQSTSAIPSLTIHESWNRVQAEDATPSPTTAADGGERENEKRNEDLNNDYSSGTSSGSMEEENMVVNQMGNNTSPDVKIVTTVPPVTENGETKQPALPDNTDSKVDSNNTTLSTIKPAVTESLNTTTLPPQTTTGSSQEVNNGTDLHTTASPSQEGATMTTEDKGLNNGSGPIIQTTATTTKGQEINNTFPVSPSATLAPETTKTIPAVTTTAAAAASDTTEEVNKTDKGAGSGDSSERGSVSNSEMRNRQRAWGAVLGTAVVVACVGLVVYIIMKKKHPKGFSHRKLVEEFPSDPVLRLDNSEPLDLNFGRSGYSNPGLQMDNIQMSNIPGRR